MVIKNEPSQPSQPRHAQGGRDLAVTFRGAVRSIVIDDMERNGPISRQISKRNSGSDSA